MATLWSDANDEAEKLKQQREARKAEESRIKDAKEEALNEPKQKEEDKKEGMI